MGLKAVTATGAAMVALLGLALLPLVALSSPATTAPCGPTGAGPVAVIEATIRQVESGDNYTARARGSTASGAYQFLDTSWANYGGYPQAWLAPPDIQDAKAAQRITQILTSSHNDVSAVPVVWYLGHLPPADSPEWDTVPGPAAGNRLTPRQYQARWMNVYQTKLAANQAATSAPGDTMTPPGAPRVCEPSSGL